MITDAAQILDIAKIFAAAKGLDLKTVSSRVFGDSKKLAAIENGADLTLSRAAAALQWLSDNWPPDAAWPDDIERPATAGAAA